MTLNTNMNAADLTNIKYYPDRFYLSLDGFDTDNLTTFLTDLNIGQSQAIFIHEYYHYLTNISSYPGIRQFSLNFCDRFRLVTNFGVLEGINAFPINTNTHHSCAEHIAYWEGVSEIIDDDDINYNVVKETAASANKSFEITAIKIIDKPVTYIIQGQSIHGARKIVVLDIIGLLNIRSFTLTFGALDEFLSSSIDEFLFENDISKVNTDYLNQRPFYPYMFFDALLAFYDLKRVPSVEKILIVHFALNCGISAVKLIEILEALKGGGYADFHNDPEKYLVNNFSEATKYDEVLNDIDRFAIQTYEQGRVHISQALKYYYDKFYTAYKLKEKDPFYFVRPFMVVDSDCLRMKQKFLLALGRIINMFTPPVILRNKEFFYIDKLSTFGESTCLIIATYEIFESIKTLQVAKRPAKLKAKYNFPDRDPECDNPETYAVPIHGIAFQLALNELGLFRIYINARDAQKAQ